MSQLVQKYGDAVTANAYLDLYVERWLVLVVRYGMNVKVSHTGFAFVVALVGSQRIDSSLKRIRKRDRRTARQWHDPSTRLPCHSRPNSIGRLAAEC